MKDEKLDAIIDRFKRMAETSTPEQFNTRLEGLILLYAYLEKAFERRFPEEFVKWTVKQEGASG